MWTFVVVVGASVSISTRYYRREAPSPKNSKLGQRLLPCSVNVRLALQVYWGGGYEHDIG